MTFPKVGKWIPQSKITFKGQSKKELLPCRRRPNDGKEKWPQICVTVGNYFLNNC